MAEDEGHPNQVIRVVSFTHPLILTREQIASMYSYTQAEMAMESDDFFDVQVIYAMDNKGWILVGNDPNPDTNEGDGVWVDPEGVEHHSP